MDQQNDNNSLRQDIQELERRIKELERHIEEKDEELRQYKIRESKRKSKNALQLAEEKAKRDQATKELSDYIAARAQEDRDRLQRVEETHRKDKEQCRDAQAREMALQQDLRKATDQVREKDQELEKSQEREEQASNEILWALRQIEEAEKETCNMSQKLSEMENKALRDVKALQEEKKKVLKQKDEALKQRDEALRKLQRSSMINFLVQCQESLFSQLASEPGSKPSTTKTDNKYKPEKLHHFSDFLEKQRAIFKKLCEVFPDDVLAFPRLITVIENGEQIEPISSEKALEMFMFAYIQGPGTQILSKLRSADKDSSVCDLFGKIKVIYYPRNLDDKIDVQRLPASTETSPAGIPEAATPSTEPQESVPGPASPTDKFKVWDDTFRPDGIYVCTKPGVGSGRNVVLFPYEVKNMIPWEVFAKLQPTDTFGEVKDGQPPMKGMTLMNGAFMQAYDYMVKSLSSFGMLTTGESIVFLYIDWDSDVKTLYYHVAIPAEDIKRLRAPDNLEEVAFHSAVGQFVTFALMAMEHCRDFDQLGRAKVRSTLKKGNLHPPTNKRTASKRKRQDKDSEEV